MERKEREKIIRGHLMGEGILEKPAETVLVTEDLYAIGMDSIKLISLLVKLEEEFDMEFQAEDMTEDRMNTIEKLLDYIKEVKGN